MRVLMPLLFACALVTGVAATSAVYAGRDDDTSTSLQDIVPTVDPDNSAVSREQMVKLATRAFYEDRDFRPAWSGSDDADERASTVRLALEHADRQGLASNDYMSKLAPWTDGPPSERDANDFDVALTEALFRYAFDVRLGRTVPKDVYKDVELPQQTFDAAAALATAVRHHGIVSFLADLPPPHPGYRWLVEALARYRGIAEQGGWPAVPAGAAITFAGKDGKLSPLAHRLALEDQTLMDVQDPLDAELREALLRFQRRNGLDDSGKLDPETLKALNVPISTRIGEILANMERWRWMPRGFEAHYILVNVPDQSLEFVGDQTAKLSSKIVIGRKNSPTPIMRAGVEAVIANPPWDIPDDIAAKKLLPHLRHDPNYLASRNMVLARGPDDDPSGMDVNWKRVAADHIPFQIQQNPGEGNVLGTLMLDSPNRFGVYMHDTPEKKLFLSNMREKSNGCIRVEQIKSLAALALGTDNAEDELADAVATGTTQRLPLRYPLAVYVVYWTAFADSDGAMEFRPDRYDRDPRLVARLTDAPHARPKATRVSAALEPSHKTKQR
jgi:L,D-transpeptidase YcbB